MALQKDISLPGRAGVVGNYIAARDRQHFPLRKHVSVHFYLYESAAQAAAAPQSPAWPTPIAKLRLQGAKYDEYLSPAVLAALGEVGPDPVTHQYYEAAKVEPLDAGGGLGSIDVSDATDV